MAQGENNFDFLASFIERLFDDGGFSSLSQEARNQFVPLFTAEAERRLGLALMPLLDEPEIEELAQLGSNPDTTPEAMGAFWRRAVPDFDTVVNQTLESFGEEFKTTMAKITSK